MALTKVTIVHDVFGHIVSVNRPAKEAKVVVLPPEGHYVFVADVESDSISDLIQTHIVDMGQKALVHRKKSTKT